jgi:hypothetical protein
MSLLEQYPAKCFSVASKQAADNNERPERVATTGKACSNPVGELEACTCT